MKSKQNSRNQMSYWQLIFSQSKVNDAPYKDDELPVFNWNWPTVHICGADDTLRGHSVRAVPL